MDTQGAFERSTPRVKTVMDIVHQRKEELVSGEGFVFATIHNIHANVHHRNIMEIWTVFQKYCQY